MTGKTQDTEFRHPETAAHFQSLTEATGAKHSPIVRESGEVRCCEVGAGEAPVGRTSETAALLAAVESEFGGGVPDLDACETSMRDSHLCCGAKGCAALFEAFEAELPNPCC